jgi:hypothetical protein
MKFAPQPPGNKFNGLPVFAKAVVGNNGYAGATGCEALSDFAQVSDHGILGPWHSRYLPQTSSLPATN